MYRSLLLTSCALLSALATGCGSLADNTDQHEPLAVLQGELANPDALATSSNVRVAVIWNCGDLDGNMYRVSQEVEVQPVFPSRFRLELTDPPPADCMVNPFADGDDNVSEGKGGPDDPDVPPSAPTTPQDTTASIPSNFRIGIGTIAAYDDLNGNGKLDLVDPDAAEYIDAVLGANESLMLVYLEGSLPQGWDELKDGNGNLPSLGYNLLNFNEPIAIPDSGDVAIWCGSSTGGGTDVGSGDSTGDVTDDPVPMPEGPTEDEYEAPTMQWMDAGTFFVLTMTSAPQFASMMCRDGFSSDEDLAGMAGPAPGAPVAVPPQYPASDAPGLSCMPDGLSYYYETCVDQGVCRGKMCTGGCWFIPDVTNPPADWPCPIP
jgi:hypothetical protein